MKTILASILALLACLGVRAATDVTISWDQSTEPIAGYKAYISTNGTVFHRSNVVLGAASTSSTFTNLPTGFYWFAVSAFIQSGTNVAETGFNTNASLIIFPKAPTGIRVTGTNQTVHLEILPNGPFRIEQSDDLVYWREVLRSSDEFDAITFRVPAADRQRFYRVASL